MINVKKDLVSIQAQIERFKKDYQETLKGTIKQNPDITVLSKKPRCFILPFSKLSIESWSPEYYDFELQVDIIIAAIKQLSAVCRKFCKITNFKKSLIRKFDIIGPVSCAVYKNFISNLQQI